jgi:amino acid adenylation domain-containing protein/thioester reductase-like protein
MSFEQEIIEGYSISPQQLTAWRASGALGFHTCTTDISLLLTGAIGQDRVNEALQRVILRHEILRSAFPVAEEIGVPLQVVSDQPALEWEHLSASASERSTGDLAYFRNRAEGHIAPDFNQGPAIRALHIRLDENRSRLFVSTSALAADAGSAAVIAKELMAALAALDEKDDDNQTAIPQYAQYSEYIRQWRDSEEGSQAASWWEDHDSRSIPPITLPFVRSTAGAARPDSIFISIPEEITARLDGLARETKLSIEALLLACWAMILTRVSGRGDGAVSVETSGRTFEEVAGMPGLFSRPLPLAFSIGESDSFVDLWRPIDATLDELRQNEDSASDLNEHSALRFSWLDASDTFQTDSIRVEVEDVFSCASPFDLRFACIRTPTSLRARLDFNALAVSQTDAALLAGYLEYTISHIAENIRERASKIDLLGPETRRLLIHDWNRTQRDLIDSRPFPIVFRERADQYANRIALRQGDQELTFDNLKRLVDAYSHKLHELGVGPESVVAVIADPCIEAAVGILAVLQSGGAFLPVDATHARERLEWILNQAGVIVALCRPSEETSFPEGPWIPISIDTRVFPPIPSDAIPPPCDQQNAAYVIYTSGSTGRPKGVVVSHRSLSNYLDWCLREYAGSGSGCALHSSLAFDLSVTSLLAPLLLGEPVCLPDGEQRADYLPSLLDERESYLWIKLTPSHARVAPGQVSSKAALGCARKLILGGEALSSHDLLEWIKIATDFEVINEYGPTEATVGCAVYRIAASLLEDGPAPIGRPIANAAIYLLDEELEPCPVGAPGEIYISGDCLARGYLYAPDLTAERFLPNPYSEQPGARMYRAGDIGRYGSDGCLEYLGRTDDQVKIHGHRVELGEVEAALAQYPMIHEAVVLARTEDGGPRLIAYFTRVAGANGDLQLSELREFLVAKLPPYMIPHTYTPVEALPLNSNGKVDRAALKRCEPSAVSGPGSYSGPRTFEEEVLATIWAKVLGVDRVSVDADYFMLGGDSIRAIQIAGLAAEAGLNVTLNSIFRHRTVRKLAEDLTDQESPIKHSTFSLISEEDRVKLLADTSSEIEDAYPLSRLQAGMVFERQLHPGTAIYHDIFSRLVRMPLDTEKLEQAVAELVARHPMLRTSFHIEGFSEPLQVVHRAVAPPISFEDLTGLPAEAQRDAIVSWMDEQKRRGFDYLAPPLLRFRAHKAGPDTFYASLSFHHAILDGWSDTSILVELALSYSRLLEGKPVGLEPPVTQYSDFIGAERAAIRSGEHREYWLNLLAGCTPTTIPRWNRPGDDGSRGVRMYRVPIGYERSRRLINLARELALPLKSVLMAAHLRAMTFVSGSADVVTTISSVGRLETADSHRVVGLHLNSAPLRLNLNGGRWVDLARATFEAEKEALPWRRYPLVETQRDLGLRRLSETSFYYTNYHIVENLSAIPSFEILEQHSYEETSFALVANFDLSPLTSEITLDLAYDRTELPLEQVRSIGGYYERAIASLASDPFANYSHIDLLSEAENSQFLDYSRGLAPPEPNGPNGTIISLFEDCARRAPNEQAVVCGESSLTYEQLNRSANRLARRLRRNGAVPDARIALFLDRSIEMIVAIFAVLKAGAAYVPIEPNHPDDRVNAILADSNPSAIVTTQNHMGRFNAQPALVIALDGHDTSIREETDSNLDDPTTPENLAYLIYTSGSTGRPKGALISRSNLLHSTVARIQWYGAPVGRFMLLSPYSFDSSIAGIFWALCSGGTLMMTPGELHKDPAAIADTMEAREITTLLATPTLYANMLESCSDKKLNGWKTAIVAGQACAAELVRNHYRLFPSVALHNEYGPTEATVWCTAEHCEPADDVVLIGKPIPYTSAYALDSQLMPAPVGTPGELFIGGAGVVRGYLDLPELTAERFLPDPFSTQPGARMYRTGDRARFRPDGRIEYLGRADWQIKIRGHRIEPEEVESAIRSIPGIRDAAVAASSQAGGDARLVGYIVADDEQSPPVQFIRAELDRLLPAYMVPSLFVFMDALPVSSNGKLDRKRLPEPTEAKRASAKYIAPRNEVEQTLADIWSAALRVPQVGIDDDFFGLGGDSILSLQVIARARQSGVQITPLQLFQARTIKALACMRTPQADDPAWSESPNFADSQKTVLAVECTPSSQADQALPVTSPFTLISEEDRLRLPDDAEDAYRLSRLQAGMVFERQLHPGDAIYHNISSYPVRMPLNRIKLEHAVAELARRHPMLRTSFHLEGFSEPLQIVHYDVQTPIAFEDLTALSAQEQRDTIARWIEEEKRRGFDDSSPPLLRFRAHKTGPDTFYLSLSAHHAILDGWSTMTILVELGSSYHNLLSGKPIGLEPPVTLYRDFVAAESAATGSVEHREYWLNLLRGCAPAMIPRWAKPSDDGGRSVRKHRISLGLERSRSLSAVARDLAVPLKSVLLAAHLRVMSFVSGSSDALTTVSSNGRFETVDGHRVIGLHLNSMPLRLDLDGGRWADLARAAFEAEQESLPWRRYPLADIQRILGLGRLSETSFNYTHYHIIESLSGMRNFEALDQLAHEETSFTLLANFELNPSTSEITLDLAHDQTQLLSEQVQALAGYYERALASIASDPFANYSRVSLLSDVEKQEIASRRNATWVDYPDDCVLHRWFERQVERTPNAMAITCEGEHISYKELNRRSNQLAHRLIQMGVGPDSLVGILMERSIEMVVALCGALKAGGAYVPLDPAHSSERLAFVLEDARISVLLTQQRLLDKLSGPRTETICLDRDWQVIDAEDGDNPTRSPEKSNLAYVIYTSGSTGKPKGVRVTHANVVRLFTATNHWFHFHDRDVWTLFHSFAFDFSVWELWGALLYGGRLVLVPYLVSRAPEAFYDLLVKEQVTVLNQTPSAFRQLMQVDKDSPHKDSLALRLLIFGGETLEFQSLKPWFERHGDERPQLVNMYGITETTVFVTYRPLTMEDCVNGAGSLIGAPIPDLQVYVLDKHGESAPIGAPGEMYVGGAGVSSGYLFRPELTAERFIPNPFADETDACLYRTGDMGRYLKSGEIEYLGRVDWQLKIRGHRIEPEEIEIAIRSTPGVRDAAVAASPSTSGEPQLVGYIAADEQQTPSAQSIRAALERKLPAYMIPSLYVFLEALPVNSNGKLDRKQLPAPTEGKRASAEYIAPRHELEQRLADIWSEALEVPQVGIDDDFFGLGGDSILGLQVIARARQSGIHITPTQLFLSRTIKALAASLQPGIEGRTSYLPGDRPIVEDLRTEAILDADIYPESLWSQDKFDLNYVLLTGSTGFLGAFLLDALIRSTQANIFCLVRCDSDEAGGRKIKQALESFRLWDQSYESRIIPVRGDLSLPLFGLSAEQFSLLAARIDTIYHNGAFVNFVHPYSALKATNVLGTREALRLACQGRTKPFHYVSTISVFSSPGDKGAILEEDEPDQPSHHSNLSTGYAQSKWVAERLAASARLRGLPVSIYRPGMISGASGTGALNPNDIFCRLIKGCIQLGSFPDLDRQINIVPVDYASQALVHLSLREESLGKEFHLVNPVSISWAGFFDCLRSFGYRLEPLSYISWRRALVQSPDNSLYPLLSTLPDEKADSHTSEQEFSLPKEAILDCANTLTGIVNSPIICPATDFSLVDKYLAYMIETGFLDAPTPISRSTGPLGG